MATRIEAGGRIQEIPWKVWREKERLMANLMTEEEGSEELNVTQMFIYENSSTISERMQRRDTLPCVCVGGGRVDTFSFMDL